VRVQGENATIEDLRSTNGTRVNGTVIERQTSLQPGDRIDLGGAELTIEHSQPARPPES
jgi:pSer/pThr/pTyr-binding forkhead associated (FHA) protein